MGERAAEKREIIEAGEAPLAAGELRVINQLLEVTLPSGPPLGVENCPEKSQILSLMRLIAGTMQGSI